MDRSGRLSTAALALFLIRGMSLVSAQSGNRHLTLREAIDIALGHSPVLQAAQHEVEATASGVDRTGAGFLPKLDFTEAFYPCQREPHPGALRLVVPRMDVFFCHFDGLFQRLLRVCAIVDGDEKMRCRYVLSLWAR
jgi:hypothetical protein